MDHSDLDKKVTAIATKAESKAEQDKIMKVQAFDFSYFRDKSHFEDDDTQNSFVFQPVYSYFKKIANSDHISVWKPKGLYDESIKSPTTLNKSVTPPLIMLTQNFE